MKKRHVKDESGMGWLKDWKDKKDRERYGENGIVRTDVSTGGLKIDFCGWICRWGFHESGHNKDNSHVSIMSGVRGTDSLGKSDILWFISIFKSSDYPGFEYE